MDERHARMLDVSARGGAMMEHVSCAGCKHDLGGGCCRINEEAECAAGEFELWEREKDD